MENTHKVVWSEGMFIRPQHFQQQDHYVQSVLSAHQRAHQSYGWGMIEFALDENLLNIGKISINKANGIFQDGTIFNVPTIDTAPLMLNIDPSVRHEIVYLGVSLKRPGVQEVTLQENNLAMRYRAVECEVMDDTLPHQSANILVAKLQLQLLLGKQDTSQFTLIPIARIIECREDGKILLDSAFIPPCLSCRASSVLQGYINELSSLLEQRGQALSTRIGDINRSAGVSAIADFLLLQVTQRFGLLFQHLSTQAIVHPESLYRLLLELAGSLIGFIGKTYPKNSQLLPGYRHQNLQLSFSTVVNEIRQVLSRVIEPLAIALPLEKREFGVYVAKNQDKQLFETAKFIIAANADVPVEKLQSEFPRQTKIGSVEQIRDLINLQLPGIHMRVLPVAPVQIPFNSKYVYFELSAEGQWWESLKQSGGIAIHTSGDFPNLKLELWAIRGE